MDLGCGTGTNVIYMASLGRQAIGVDFVPSAIAKARKKARQAGVSSRVQFFVADVTRLAELNLSSCAFALDMGCFHSLNADGQRRYIAGLSSLLVPGGLYMLYALDPRQESGRSFGITPEQVQTVFSPAFDIQRVERGEFRKIGSTWFWMRRKA
jgi:cyclopropane fatty-acyl-phospholipid synthase-like methyltransferase